MDKVNKIEMGERVRNLRESMFQSRERFSEMVDISEVFLGQIERGECSISVKTLANLVSYTGSSADFILFGDNSQNSYTKKINRILENSSDETVELIYNVVNDIYRYNKKTDK